MPNIKKVKFYKPSFSSFRLEAEVADDKQGNVANIKAYIYNDPTQPAADPENYTLSFYEAIGDDRIFRNNDVTFEEDPEPGCSYDIEMTMYDHNEKKVGNTVNISVEVEESPSEPNT